MIFKYLRINRNNLLRKIIVESLLRAAGMKKSPIQNSFEIFCRISFSFFQKGLPLTPRYFPRQDKEKLKWRFKSDKVKTFEKIEK